MEQPISLLQDLMKKEIGAMREILANMHQEELSLMLNDQIMLIKLMDDRSKLLALLSDIRLERIATTKKLKVKDIQELLSVECEVILSLVERMNVQNIRNTFLNNHPPHHLDLRMNPTAQTSPQRAKNEPL